MNPAPKGVIAMLRSLGPAGLMLLASAAAQAADTTRPSTPTGLTVTVVSPTQINLAWHASTDNVGVTGYLVYRCAYGPCSSNSNFIQTVGWPTTTSFSDTGLYPSTTYNYKVRATDAAGNLSNYSATASGTTQWADTTPPSSPGPVTATVVSSTQVNLSWNASTDNVGVTGYQVRRGTLFSTTQIATTTATSYSDTGLTPGTTYLYVVAASDAAGNVSSSIVYATTPAGDTTAPSTPTGLTANAASSTQINLSWTASTDDVGVTGYPVERCQGTGCTTFAQIAAPAATSLSDTGLTAGTNYSYRVRATDAAGNLSAYSNVASTTTSSGQVQAYYIQTDHLNTPRLIEDQNQTAVWKRDQGEPFGNDVPNNNPSGVGAFEFPLRFPGQYTDKETNLAYNYFRDYDPGTGRYVRSDPIGIVGGANTYAYVLGNPLRSIDIYGLRDIVVAIWNSSLQDGSVGHVFVGEVNGTTILSQFPSPSGLRGANITRDWFDTLVAEMRNPDVMYKVYVPDDAKFDRAVEDLRQRPDWFWNPRKDPNSTNCSASALSAIEAGGVSVPTPTIGPVSPSDLGHAMEQLIRNNSQNVTRLPSVPWR